jgi:DNA modification methylase
VIYTGDAIETMRTMPSESIDAIVTDPPAAVSFMGRKWDSDRGGRTQWVAWMTEVMQECYRLLKPGGYAVVWSLPRTCHWTAWAMEDAGFIIRDQLAHIFAVGFPKGKAQLKPAREDWWLARKPGPLRPLGIDAGRIPGVPDAPGTTPRTAIVTESHGAMDRAPYEVPSGRWPSNVLLSDPALFDEPNPFVVGSGAVSESASGVQKYQRADTSGWKHRGGVFKPGREWEAEGYGDTGGYSRFFIVPKSSRADREPVLRGQLERSELQTMGDGANGHDPARPIIRENAHPTVKPVDLMRHLIHLVTPQGGTVLDCFAGSGSTLIAAELEGFSWIGIEKEPEYVAIAEARLNGTQRGLGLDVGAPTQSRKPSRGHVPEVQNYREGAGLFGFSGYSADPDEEPAA